MENMKNELKSMFTEHWKYLAVTSACELELFDKVFDGQNSLERLIQNNFWNVKNFTNLLEYLCNDGYLKKTEAGELALTDKSNLLRKNNPHGLYHACLNWASEHLIAWQNLKFSIESGESSFEHIYHKPYFDYLNDNLEKLNNYHKAMFEYAVDDYKELPEILDFSSHASIMDVGGGYGAAISLIQKKHPNIPCFLFDLERVTNLIPNKALGKISGDFFKEIPSCSDAIILSRVLHDWNDEKSKVILTNCYNALPNNGSLYIIENCTDKIQTNLSLLSLNMAVMCQSFERSSLEYLKLSECCGFKFYESKPLNKLQTILIFKK